MKGDVPNNHHICRVFGEEVGGCVGGGHGVCVMHGGEGGTDCHLGDLDEGCWIVN